MPDRPQPLALIMRRWHLIGYDVRDAKRLRQVARCLEGYGERVQYSLFRCRLDDTAREKLRCELQQICNPEDDLLIVPLCETCAGKVAEHSAGRHDDEDWSEPPPRFEIL